MNLYNLIHKFSHDFKNQAVDLHSYFFFLKIACFCKIQIVCIYTKSPLCKIVMFSDEIGLEMLPRKI